MFQQSVAVSPVLGEGGSYALAFGGTWPPLRKTLVTALALVKGGAAASAVTEDNYLSRDDSQTLKSIRICPAGFQTCLEPVTPIFLSFLN